MTNAKDYLSAREHMHHVPTAEELKSLLESVIDNGKDIFVLNGFIPLDNSMAEVISKYQQKYGILSFKFGIENWLKDYNWRISSNPSVSYGHSALALFAVQE